MEADKAAPTSAIVSPNESNFSGSTMTWYSAVSPPSTSMLAIPETVDNSGADLIESDVSQIHQRAGIGSQAVAEHRKDRRIHAANIELRFCGQRRENQIDRRFRLQRGGDHVLVPTEIDRNFGAAATGRGSQTAYTQDGADRFLDRLSHFDGHPLCGTVAGVDADDDTRKGDLGKEADRQSSGRCTSPPRLNAASRNTIDRRWL